MTVRTTETTVTFRLPFILQAFDRRQPAGTYKVIIEEEEIPSLAFLAYHRTATMLHVPAIGISGRSEDVFFVSSAELDTALKADAQAKP